MPGDDAPPTKRAIVVQFAKAADGPATLTLVRADGSSTTSHLGAADGLGPLYDLAYVVVERRLALPDGYLALMARGWQFSDFEARTAAQIGPDAVRVQCIAGLLSLEAITARPLALADFNDTVAARCSETRPGFAPPDLGPTSLHAMRSELAALLRRWDALAPGQSLEVSFEPGQLHSAPWASSEG